MLIDKAKDTIVRLDLLDKGDRVLVAVSGGPDSIALLYVLRALKKELGLKLFACHLNHMIRPGAAENDAAFVERSAGKLGVPVIIEKQDVPARARCMRLSIEAAARDARYDFYRRSAAKFGANKVALAHTSDDQAETVLMRLLRGSGLLGLSGIPARRALGGVELVRPFINIPKKEVLAFLSRRKIAFCKDATNKKAMYLRNKIRLKLIPFIEKEFEPDIKRILAGTGENLRVDYDYLSRAARARFRKYAGISQDAVSLKEAFLDEDAALQRMIIREALKMVKGDLASVTYSHWKQLNRLLGEKKRWAMTLPGGITAKKARGRLIFSRRPGEKCPSLRAAAVRLAVPGSTTIPGTGRKILAGFVKPPADFRNKTSANIEYFDPLRLRFPLTARFRRPKDTIRPIGMRAGKRLKQLFIDEKVPFEDRASVPIVISGGKVIWACGIKRSDHAKLHGRIKKAIRLKFL